MKHATRLLLRSPRPATRTKASSKAFYDHYVASTIPDWDRLETLELALVDGSLTLRTVREFHQVAVDLLAEAIDHIQARSILEVGCGEGVNRRLMNDRHPGLSSKVEWHGFDYSFARAERARATFPAVPWWTGDATAIALRDRTFDLAVTIWVLEQLPNHWSQAVSEMLRVANYALLIEPFYDEQGWFGRLHIRVNDYCRMRTTDISQQAEVVWQKSPAVVVPFYKTKALLVRRRPVDSR